MNLYFVRILYILYYAILFYEWMNECVKFIYWCMPIFIHVYVCNLIYILINKLNNELINCILQI